jgi:hypothetical protein
MERLGALEIDFARAVLDASAEVPAPLTRQTGGTPSRRFGVYRNNVYASLIEALTGRFPVVARLVGDEFFRGMARVYIERDPPRSPVLLCYGEGFPAFVAQFPPAVAVPYLADVARLEWAWHAAYHTADAAPLSLAALKKAAGGAEDVALTLHPSLSVVRSAWPVITIWQINAADGAPGRAQLPPGARMRSWRGPGSMWRCADCPQAVRFSCLPSRAGRRCKKQPRARWTTRRRSILRPIWRGSWRAARSSGPALEAPSLNETLPARVRC